MKKTYLLLMLLSMCVMSVNAGTVAYWRFEDGVAGNDVAHNAADGVWSSDVTDVSGNGNDLAIWSSGGYAGYGYRSEVGTWAIPQTGAANNLSVRNTGSVPGMFTQTGSTVSTISPSAFTIEASFKLENGNYRTIIGRDSYGTSTANADAAALYLQAVPNNALAIKFCDVAGYWHEAVSAENIFNSFDAWGSDPGGTTVPWYSMAAVSDGSTLSLYLKEIGVTGWNLIAQTDMTASGSTNTALTAGAGAGDGWDAGNWTVGRGLYAGAHGDRAWGYIDELRISDSALAVEDFLLASELATWSVSSPADNARGIDSDVALSWLAAPATQYAVYFGDDFASVRDADINDITGLYKGSQSSPASSAATLTYSPGTLVDGKTYYWRIDQQDDIDPGVYWKGPVWTFTVGHAKYRFNGSMSRETTEAYLARSITWGLNENPGQFAEDLRCILNIGAKLIARTATPWIMVSNPSVPNVADDEYYFDRLAYYADLIHAKDSEIILQGCIFEAIGSAYDTGYSTGTRVRPGIEDIPIPAWVFQEFGQPVVQRNFSYQNMLHTDGYRVDNWQPGVSVQDITRLETKMWTYYRGRRFIDAGYESIHFGQTNENMISKKDPTRASLYDVLGRLRAYALQNARRGFILCDAHDGDGVVQGGQLLYDNHIAPARPHEQCGTQYEAILEFGWLDSIYGNSVGGITPSGWYCDSLPYNVEIDNFGIEYWEYAGTCGNLPTRHWVWGWDEMSWFANCSESYRNYWLEYAVDWLKTNDPVGYLRMPGLRSLEAGTYPPVGAWTQLYRPNSTPYGFNQEETIKRLWNPTIVNNGVTGITKDSATLNGEILNTNGEDPTVIVYWGDNDGGTIAGDWDYADNLGIQSGSFTDAISGLKARTTYYFRCYAFSSQGSDWADSTSSFLTACGDVSGDCDTDIEDLLLFAASWLEDECPLTVPEADLNGDCKVDLFDFVEFAEKWLD